MSLKVLKIDLRMIVHSMDNKAVKIYTKEAGNGEPKKTEIQCVLCVPSHFEQQIHTQNTTKFISFVHFQWNKIIISHPAMALDS